MKKTRILFSLLMAVVMMAMSPQRVWAWYEDSDGTRHLVNADDFADFSSFVNAGILTIIDANVKLDNDVTLPSDWVAIGSDNSGKRFKGTFDGQGHTITFSNSSQGLFGCIDGATIQNLKLSGSISAASNNIGSVIHYAKGNSTLKDIASSVDITISGSRSHLGGIAGNIESGTSVLGCTYSGTLNAGSSSDSNGGIVGFAHANCSGSIKYCFFNGTVKTTSSAPVIGGILGYTNDESNNFGGVQNCYSCGTLTFAGNDDYANAIVGRIRAKSHTTINNTFLDGTATRAANTNCDEKVDFTKNKAITISVTAGANGTVSKSYVNPTSTTATQLQVVASPSAHYHFVSWSDSKAQTHNVELTANVNLTASFAIDTHKITVNVASGQSDMGTVNTSGGTYDYNTKLTITATPKTGYKFVKWSDDNTSASRTITVTEDKTYTATFAPIPYTITVNVASGQSNMGTVEGSGTYGYGTLQTIIATPKTGYHFVKWSDNNTSASRTITVNGNATYTATFAAHTYGDWITDNAANCTASGTKHRTCKICAATDNSTIDELGHDYTVESDDDAYLAYAASCITDAVYYHKCSRCDSKGTTTWTKTDTKHGHNLDNHSRCTNKGCNYKAKAVYDNGTLTFYFDDLDHSGSTYSLNAENFIPDWHWDQTNERINITAVVFDASFSAARPTTCFWWFSSCKDLTGISGIENLNTEEVKWMSRMFGLCTSLKSLDLSSLNTKNVEQMGDMFADCTSLKSLDLSGFNTEKVVNMFEMFSHCEALTSLDLSSFNTTNVTTMKALFYNCDALENLTIGNFDMQLVTDISFMFDFCNALNTLTLKSLPFLKHGTFNTRFSGNRKTVNYELNDNSVIYTGANNLPAATSATYNRAGIKNQWGTIVVPFEVDGSGDDYDLYTLSEATDEHLTLTRVNGTLAAGTPALIRLKDGLAGNYNLTITAADPAVTTQMEEGSEADGLQLAGAYEATQLTANDYFIANNKFWLAGDMSAPVKAAPFRAYLKNTGAGAMASALNIAVEDDSATAIDALNMLNDTDAQYYDLNGRRIPQLQKGINIVKYGNGKTVKVNIK